LSREQFYSKKERLGFDYLAWIIINTKKKTYKFTEWFNGVHDDTKYLVGYVSAFTSQAGNWTNGNPFHDMFITWNEPTSKPIVKNTMPPILKTWDDTTPHTLIKSFWADTTSFWIDNYNSVAITSGWNMPCSVIYDDTGDSKLTIDGDCKFTTDGCNIIWRSYEGTKKQQSVDSDTIFDI
jgi:hypothetical protein